MIIVVGRGRGRRPVVAARPRLPARSAAGYDHEDGEDGDQKQAEQGDAPGAGVVIVAVTFRRARAGFDQLH